MKWRIGAKKGPEGETQKLKKKKRKLGNPKRNSSSQVDEDLIKKRGLWRRRYFGTDLWAPFVPGDNGGGGFLPRSFFAFLCFFFAPWRERKKKKKRST